MSQPRIRVGVSACLLGQPVRFDGGHKHAPLVTQTLGQFFDLVPLCPEMALGLGAPRQSLRLVGEAAQPRAVGNRDGVDYSTELINYGRQSAAQLLGGAEPLCGFIVKKDSPSCGMERVRVYGDSGIPAREGVGLFTRELLKAHPWLPLEEEGRLNDPSLRENFIERVFVCQRWWQLRAEGLTPARLVEFHTTHKYMLMARGASAYRQLGRLVAAAGSGDLEALAQRYFLGLMAALQQLASRGNHSNVLMHLMGYLKRQIAAREKQELLGLIDDYRHGELPLVVPVTMLKHHLGRHPQQYLQRQHYFAPYPERLGLRNGV
jgi:uncharacterized protein YbgA (DUF1722 family)/uncharacterized protein YbbK (DUF523 family)